MASFGIQIEGDRRAVLRFEKFPAAAHDRLKATLESLKDRLIAAVHADEPRLSGQLVQMTGGRVYDHGDRIAAVVGVRAETADEARKAAALEYGSRRRALMLRAHQAKLSHLWSRAISPIIVTVPAHSRVPNIDPRRYLRDPLEAMREEALAEMEAAVAAAAEETPS